MSILDLLARVRGAAAKPSSSHNDADAVRRIVASLDQLSPERARYIAAFAYVLARVAFADRSISVEEVAAMEKAVREQAELPEEQAIIVVQLAKTQATLFGGTEDFLVTRELDQIATLEQKKALLRCLFAVSAAEGGIATVEDNEIRRIAVELKIPHDEYINARVEFRQHLTVLRNDGAK